MKITATLHSYAYASDLHQYIPFYNRKVILERNKHGNLNVTHMTNPYARDKTYHFKWDYPNKLTFNKRGECLSFTEPKAGYAAPLPKLSNITTHYDDITTD